MAFRVTGAFVAALCAAAFALPARADFYAGLEAHARGDYATALAEWLPLAEAGDSSAQGNLGVMYWLGQGVAADPVEAARWFLLAAERGNPEAQNNLGQMYYLGEGVPRDVDAAAHWIKAAAYQDDPSAQLRLGILYAEGLGVERDPERALAWWKKSAAQGNTAAEARVAAAGGDADVAAVPAPPVTEPTSEPALSSEELRAAQDVDPAPVLPPAPPAVESPPPPAPVAEVAAPAPEPPEPVAVSAPAAPTPNLPDVADEVGEPSGESASALAAPESQGFLVQIASVGSQEDAEREWTRLQRRNRALLGDLELDVERRELGPRVVYRLRAGPPRDRASAERLCAALEERRVGCLLREAP